MHLRVLLTLVEELIDNLVVRLSCNVRHVPIMLLLPLATVFRLEDSLNLIFVVLTIFFFKVRTAIAAAFLDLFG